MAKIDKDEYLDPTIPLLEVRDLAVSFGNPSSPSSPRVQAVAGVNMTIYPRQTLAVVGESGCGKSVTAMSTMQLVPRPPGRFDGGKALFRGDDVLEFNERQIRSLRGDDIANAKNDAKLLSNGNSHLHCSQRRASHLEETIVRSHIWSPVDSPVSAAHHICSASSS